MSEVAYIPQLRFPEFSDEWSGKALIDTVDKNIKWGFTGGPFGSDLKSDDYTESGVRIIQLQNIGDGVFINKHKIYTSESKANSLLSCNIFPNEILISKMGDPVARACLMPEGNDRYLMSSDGIRFIPDSRSFARDFIFLSINSTRFRRQAISLSTGSTRRRIGLTDLRKIKFNIPTLPEQQKIAAFLTAVDNKIEQLGKKKALLGEYKKGLMQQIFSQAIRFKTGDGSDWTKTNFGSISTIKRGASPRPISNPKWFDDNSSIGWVRISDVTKSKKYLKKTQQYLSSKGVKKSRLVAKNNLIMSICATIGKPIYTDFDVCIHDGFIVFDSLSENKDFIYYLLEKIQKKWYRYGQPGTQVNLNSDIVSLEILSLPTKPEQQKIAAFLTVVDNKIEKVGKQLDESKQFKKALLQQMFV